LWAVYKRIAKYLFGGSMMSVVMAGREVHLVSTAMAGMTEEAEIFTSSQKDTFELARILLQITL
jgi:hypothetical protein